MQVQGTTVFHHEFSGDAWLGGTHYFNNLRSVTERFHPEIEVKGLNLNACPTIYTKLSDRIRMSWYNRVIGKVPPAMKDAGRENYLRSIAPGRTICIYSTNYKHLLPFPRLPKVLWIPDFQIFHLPEFFKPEDIEERKLSYSKGGKLARLVVLSSEAAQKDLVRFFPELASKSRVLHFVTELPDSVFTSNPNYVNPKYRLPEKYFYVPNQYWKHKNHKLIVEAVDILAKQQTPVHVVFSGSQSDPRNPEWFSELQAMIEANHLRNYITELGIIPKEDVYALMRQSCALINVSRFEGWSTSVEESKAIGKRIILSDIPVHIEQAPMHGYYTGTDDAVQLAKYMTKLWTDTNSGPDERDELNARNKTAADLRIFAENFAMVINEACERTK